MTREDEARWAGLAEAATPGPWSVELAKEAASFYGSQTFDVTTSGVEHVAVGGVVEDGGPHVGACLEHDALFIAAARTAVPALLAALAAAREDADEQREAAARMYEKWMACFDALAAVRVEVAQLQAALRQIVDALDQLHDEDDGDDPCGCPTHQVEAFARLALAEPLGSTPEQEQAK